LNFRPIGAKAKLLVTAQSLCKIYLHLVFHIKTTSPSILESHLNEVHCYIGKLVNITGCQVLRVGGVEDHVHIVCQLGREQTIARLVEEIKRNSSRWVKTLSPHYRNFAWQSGYAVFSVSQSGLDKTIAYVNNQREHHSRQTFRDEYLAFLRLYHVEYDEKYVMRD
jgi:REP element-mobilizing transposase RayT